MSSLLHREPRVGAAATHLQPGFANLGLQRRPAAAAQPWARSGARPRSRVTIGPACAPRCSGFAAALAVSAHFELIQHGDVRPPSAAIVNQLLVVERILP